MSLSSERYDGNIEILNKKDPALGKHLDEMPLTSIRMQPIGEEQDELYGQIYCPKARHWVPLGSEKDAVTQAKSDVDQLYSDRQKIFCLIGMGLGYFAVEFAKRLRGYQRMAIFDLSPSVYKAAMYCVDLAPILGDHKVDTFIGESIHASIDKWWQTLNSHEKFYIAEPMRAAYTAGYEKEKYDEVMLKTYDMIRYHKVGLATWKTFGGHIGDNDFANMPDYLALPGGEALKNIWKDRPAVCIAAGPSLKKNLALLMNPKLRENVCVLTVGTVYATLKGMGIIPDIVTTIDFQRLNYTDQFHRVPLDTGTALVYLHSTYPETVRRWPGPKFVTLNSSDSVGWIEQTTKTNKMHAAQVQTVAHLNVVMAAMMGCNPIMLIGQDLAMPFEDHHAPGARVQDTSPEENPDSHVRAKDIYGDDCWTRHSFLSMRTVFAQLMRKYDTHQFVNCTEGGIGVDGMNNMSFATAMQRIAQRVWPVREMPLKDEIAKIYNDYEPDIDWDEVIDKVSDLRTHVGVTLSAAKQVVDKAAMIDEFIANQPPTHDPEVLATIDGLREDVKNDEKTVTAYPAAFSLFAVRCFPIVELMSQCPPPDGTTEDEMKLLTYERLVTVCGEIVRNGDHIDRILKKCIQRFKDFTLHLRPDPSELHRMIARGSYDPVKRWIYDAMIHPRDGEDPEVINRLMLRLLYHQQQYEMLDGSAEFSGQLKGMARRGRTRITQLSEVVVPILPLYFNRDGEEMKQQQTTTTEEVSGPAPAVAEAAEVNPQPKGVPINDYRIQPANPGRANGSARHQPAEPDIHEGGPGVQDRDPDLECEQ